ncbi:MAG: hypothetical protein CL920_34320 [Deltaproteobacteria bacterium]|nr:hypothetical protein [Deltaproteobacteria bacterium]MBU53800.1 hypothetical protein [Deltaproteobacteria bacterium]|tara:strand:+ start:4258 stop:5148 length:891 start_codon:yes stop_codon:yes gene_type:complete
MSSSILFIGLQEDESTLLREACSLEDYTVEEVSNVVMPPRDQVDPDLVILSTRTPQETLSDFASQDQLRSRMLLIVHEPDWEILQDVAPFGVIAARSSLDEIRYRLRDAFQRKGEQLIRRLGLLQQRDGSVWDMLPSTDWVTGLNNRMRFLQELEKNISRSKRYNRPLCCLLARINDYEDVRQRLGDELMDDLLEEIAGILEVSIREADFLARIRDDLFGLILPETDKENAHVVRERVQKRFEHLHIQWELGDPLSFSYGLAALDPEDSSMEGLLANAQSALDTTSIAEPVPHDSL